MDLYRACLIAASLIAASAALVVDAASSSAAAGAKVYLMRGLFDVSTGLDALASRLNRRGIPAKVASYTDRDGLSAAAIQAYKSGGCPIVIVGHSLGADAAIDMSETLRQAGVPVALLVSFSPAYPRSVPANVAKVVNYFQSDSAWNNKYTTAAPTKSSVRNVDLVKDGSIHHFNIEKSGRLQTETLRMIADVNRPCAGVAAKRP